MYAILHNGERMWVASLDGHDGCTVIAEGVEPSPEPCSLCPRTGKAILDQDAKERARIDRMTNAELIDEILRRLG